MLFISILIMMITPVILVIGLMKPRLVLRTAEPTRGKVIKIYGAVWFLALIIGVISTPTPGDKINEPQQESATDKPAVAVAPKKPAVFEHAGMLLKEYMEESKLERKDIAESYVEFNGLDKSATGPFHACLSYMGRKKVETLTVGEVLSWCLQDYKNNPASLTEQYIDYDAFEGQFSAWDGSHSKLESYIKEHMNDPDSYEHVETRYRVVQTKTERHAVISTTFRGKNAYGGVVKNVVVAKTNLDTGDVLEIIEQR